MAIIPSRNTSGGDEKLRRAACRDGRSRGEPVAEPLYCHDQAGRRAVSLDRFSQPRDMDIDGPRAHVVGEAPHVTLQLFPCDELPATLQQIDEQLKLARR